MTRFRTIKGGQIIMNSIEYTALFIVIALILFGLILSLSNKARQKKEKKNLWKEFDDFVIKNNLAIDKKQSLNKNVIGIDRLNHKLIFLDKSDGISKFHMVNLYELSDCRLIKQKNKSNGHISNIFLQCIFSQKDIADIFLPFYNEMDDNLYKLMRLSRKAYYWQKSINIFRQAAVLSTAQ
jgi:hypothetical protein